MDKASEEGEAGTNSGNSQFSKLSNTREWGTSANETVCDRIG